MSALSPTSKRRLMRPAIYSRWLLGQRQAVTAATTAVVMLPAKSAAFHLSLSGGGTAMSTAGGNDYVCDVMTGEGLSLVVGRVLLPPSCVARMTSIILFTDRSCFFYPYEIGRRGTRGHSSGSGLAGG